MIFQEIKQKKEPEKKQVKKAERRGRPKKYQNRSISFGREGSEERLLVDSFIDKNGTGEFSKMAKQAITAYLSVHPKYKDFKRYVVIQQLRHKYFEIQTARAQLAELMTVCKTLDIDPNSVLRKCQEDLKAKGAAQ